ncbi:ABC transporter permease [Mesorhizobium sp. PUT5]|uniref:ABC transporter permease n=1 Tax=Mesorhizobium sp. PUT5 TaxID=3454629 RepID=UPI003FA4735F
MTDIMAFFVYLFLIAPTIVVVPMSFGQGSELVFPPREWGLGLYRQMLDPATGWLSAGWNSLQIALAAALLSIVLGVPAAYALARARIPGMGALRFSAISPIFIPTIVLALGLYFYFIAMGINGSKLGLILAHTLLITPFVILTVGASLNQLDRNVEVAASVCGAGPFRVFVQIVIPSLRPAILIGGLFAFLLSFDEVVVAWFIGRSADPTLPVKMYSSIQWEVSPVLAAISTVLVIAASIVCIIAAAIQPPTSNDH